MQKIIFLDLDGVLNIMEGKLATFKNKLDHFEKYLINNFNKFLEKNEDINIVISSSWRSDMDDLYYMLNQSGFKFNNRIIGHTPLDSKKLQFRGEQINFWLMDNKFNGKYICIDDSINQICEFGSVKINKDFCLKIDPSIGISNENIYFLNNYFKS